MKRLFPGLIAGLTLILVACGQSPQPKPTPSPTPTPSASEIPTKLEIPAINVDANVEQVGDNAAGAMDVPKVLDDVAWYKLGVHPGQPGDAVIAGHKDDVKGGHHVFWSLRQLKPGDEVDVLTQAGHKLQFQVKDTQELSADSTWDQVHQKGLFVSSGDPRLSLITCTGDVNPNRTAYLQRLVVDASYKGVS